MGVALHLKSVSRKKRALVKEIITRLLQNVEKFKGVNTWSGGSQLLCSICSLLSVQYNCSVFRISQKLSRAKRKAATKHSNKVANQNMNYTSSADMITCGKVVRVAYKKGIFIVTHPI